ncbi:MAG: hypothetical protein LBS31_05465, partial [Candidatus Adiutrix sp.]|nr:hypothetical protein [Candidatus Adiutrix sp.]
MKHKVKIVEQAKSDMRSIYKYIAEQLSEPQTAAFSAASERFRRGERPCHTHLAVYWKLLLAPGSFVGFVEH